MATKESEYRLVYHRTALANLRGAIERLLEAGWEKSEVARMVTGIEARLKSAPLAFGEPHYSVPGTKLKVAVGFERPLSVQIGIHEELRIVFVRKVSVMTTEKN